MRYEIRTRWLKKWVGIWTMACFGIVLQAAAHVGDHPSVHDTVANVAERFKKTLSHDELRSLTTAKVESLLTPDERHILGTEHLSFRVNVPVTVYVARDVKLGDEPFWLKEQSYERTEMRFQEPSYPYDVWKKTFDAGRIGLGVNSLAGGNYHYFVVVVPQKEGDYPQVRELYPGQSTLGTVKVGEKPFVDRDETLESVPKELEGQTLIRTARGWRDHGKLIGIYRFTRHLATNRPDNIILTWSDDPTTTQTIQWRTSVAAAEGVVAYQKKADYRSFNEPKPPKHAEARTDVIETKDIVNDPVIHWHTAVLRDLEPDTTYVYSVGDGSKEGWTEHAEFTTAPKTVKPFSFIYMGDAQNGLNRWGTLVRNAFRERPDAAFYVMAGDLVNRGAERDDWDDLFYNAQGVYTTRQLVPVLGNHEYQGGSPDLYLKFFDVLKNGPANVPPEKAYAFEYSNALFVILDSNISAESQTAWLEEQLAKSKATWKFVTYHHPAYSSAPNRDNKGVRELWTPIFDKYHVDLALQGHDHAYLRTYPMNGQKRVASAKEGTIYLVSVSGIKFYEQDPRDYTEFGMTNTSTYQALDVQIDGNRLLYRAYDTDGRLKDEFVIEK